MAPKALAQPIPRSMWLLAGLSIGVPVLLATYIRSYRDVFESISTPADEVLGDIADPVVEAHYREVMKSVGIENPEQVAIRETQGLGPMVVGSQGQGVLYVPHLMVSLSNPEHALRISQPLDDQDEQQRNSEPDTRQPRVEVLFDGKVGDMTPDDRQTILEHGGPLLPNERELDYIIGHEAAHLLHDDTRRSAITAAAAVVGAHLSLKLYNRVVHERWPRLAVRGVLPYSLLVGCMASAAILVAGMIEEAEADIESARALQCADVAVGLVDKKLRQNMKARELGASSTVTESGNDLASWRHPPLTLQRRYLQWVAHEQQELRRALGHTTADNDKNKDGSDDDDENSSRPSAGESVDAMATLLLVEYA